MSVIRSARAFQIDLPVKSPREDSMQSFVKQETIFVDISTSDGLQGRGYSYTIGNGASSVLAMLDEHFLLRLIGANAHEIDRLWHLLRNSSRATTVGAITSLALAAVDTALSDLRGKRAEEPLWTSAGGHRRDVALYDTEGGWLQLSVDELVANARTCREAGWNGIKMKVGKPKLGEDVERVAAVRAVLGDGLDLMLDANQCFSRAEAVRRAAAFEPYQIRWFEEPMPAEDVAGHLMLSQTSRIPVAVGESLYSIGQFSEYLSRGAASIIQVDAARVGGITPWLKVAHAAEAANLEVCPHFLMELHISLAAAIPNGSYVEHVPQLDLITTSGIRVQDGWAQAPTGPGLGIECNEDAIEALQSAERVSGAGTPERAVVDA